MTSLSRFTPNWFTTGMGTGITAIGAFLLPGGAAWLKTAATGLWLLNLVLVTVLSVLMLLRWILDRKTTETILHDPVQSMFLGAIPMAVTTVVNGFVLMGPAVFGPAAFLIAERLWLFNVGLAVASGIVVPYAMFVRHEHSLQHMTGIWLMPIVPAEVVAASGGLIIPHVHSVVAAKALVVVSLGLWAFSVPLAFLVLGVLFLRLALHRLPPREMAISTWISLGTLGTGVMGLMGIGRSLPTLFGALGTAMTGAATLGALALWGFGIWWFVMSVLLTLHHARRGLPFNLGWWGLTFPLGVFTGGTDLLYAELHVAWLGVVAVGFYLLLAAFWLLVGTRTVAALWAGLASRAEPPNRVSEQLGA
jgi:C4-dicarboxylate transporter/malic acid transport protein